MTSSDRTELRPDDKDRLSRRVGISIDGGLRSAAPGIRAGFACAEFNGGITARLLAGAALDVLEESGGDLARSVLAWAPGAFELPLVALGLARSGTIDAVIALGAVIRGDTGHYDFVAGECAGGLQRVQLDTGIPVVFGVLTTDTVEQALLRSGADETNKGREAARCALSMGAVLDGVASAVAGERLGFSSGRH